MDLAAEIGQANVLDEVVLVRARALFDGSHL
jgi:hypothetical protein